MLTLSRHLLVGAALAAGPPVLPEPPAVGVPIRIAQPASDACGPVDAVGADVEQLSGGALRIDTAASSTVRLATTPTSDGIELALAFDDAGIAEQRRLPVSDCATAHRAAALIIAVTLAPVDTASVVAPAISASSAEVVPPTVEVPALRPARPEPEPEPVPATRQPPAPEPSPPTRSQRPERWQLALWTGPVLATNPRISAVAGLEIGPRLGPIALVASGWHAFASERVDDGIGARASVSAGGLAAWVPLRLGPTEVRVGAGVAAGALVGRGAGSRVEARNTTSPWLAITFGAGFAWPAQGRFALVIRAEGTAPLLRPAISVDRAMSPVTVFNAAPVGGRVVLGPAVRFP